MKKNRILLCCMAVSLCLVMIVSGSFAWFTSTDSVRNHLETAQITDGSVSILEVFVPEPLWKPGQTVTKQVAVTNNGSGNVLVRVSFEEIMSLLETPATGSDTAAADTAVPQLYNAVLFQSAPWEDLSGFSEVTGMPSDVTVKMKKTVTNLGTPEERTSYSFAIYSPITTGTYAGQNQRVTAKFNVDGDKLVISDVQYWQYDSRIDTEKAWADFVDPQTMALPTPPENDAIDNPIVDTGKKILINYTDRVGLTTAAPTAGKWWYNEEDGFFYYIGSVAPGTATPNLMESLTLANDAGEEYANMSFDLIVNMEAIQNTQDAIAAANGWNLSGNTALLEAYEEFCE